MFLRRLLLPCLIVLVSFIAAPGSSQAINIIEVQFTPTADLQLVVWVEDAQGTFVDTIFITRTTGSFGLGNRPGIMEFNSEFLWPYGRRETTFPVWAHRHGQSWPLIVFQDSLEVGDMNDEDLSHAIGESSVDSHFCRPVMSTESQLQEWIDANTCATTVYTDKGMFHATNTSLYPPRNDLMLVAGTDHTDVSMYEAINDMDAISQATPVGLIPFAIRITSADLPDGDYVVWMEVSKEFDQNTDYNFPSPTGIPWSSYGRAYRGQPSVVWSAPFTVGPAGSTEVAAGYVGYGDPDGLDGNLRAPDATITTGMEGSGAERLLLESSAEGMYRMRVASRTCSDFVAPGMPTAVSVRDITSSGATVDFVASGSDGESGTVDAYMLRVLGGKELTADNFLTEGKTVAATIVPGPPGSPHSFTIEQLAPQTEYWIGIQSSDVCLNFSPLAIAVFVTPRTTSGNVSTCSISVAGRSTVTTLAGWAFLCALVLSRRRRVK